MLAPVALFVYNRLDNTRQTIQHLMANTLASETDVYVFSDGGRDEKAWRKVNELRKYLHEVEAEVRVNHSLRSFTIVERPENFYLERNIIEGISSVFEKHDRIIVLEDDICTSPYFLEYMNRAFELYANDLRVMHVSGFTNLDLINEHPGAIADAANNETYFTPHMAGWGWGTWRDRWQNHFVHFQAEEEALAVLSPDDIERIEYGGVFPCLKSLQKRPIPWDCCWEIAIHRAGGLCLSPAYTLVRNIGLNQGTHFRAFSILQHYNYDRVPLSRPLRIAKVDDPKPSNRIEALFADAIRDWGIRYTWLGKILRWLLKFLIDN